MQIPDTITQANVVALLDLIEDGGVMYEAEWLSTWPILRAYMLRERWATVMSNGVVRSTEKGAALRRFARLAPEVMSEADDDSLAADDESAAVNERGPSWMPSKPLRDMEPGSRLSIGSEVTR